MSIFSSRFTQFLALLGLSSVLLLSGCTSSSDETSTDTSEVIFRDNQFLMGTSVNLSVYGYEDASILDRAFEHIQFLEDTLSLNQSNTLLETVNQNAGLEAIPVTAHLFDVVEKGLYYSDLTDGSFDITIGPLVKLWNIGFPEARVPSASEIEAVLPLIDYSKIQLDDTTQSVFLQDVGMQLDLGGIAKGYAADQIVELFKESGVAHALIDLGGNLYTLGTKPDGSLWKVGVQDPFKPRGEIIGYMEVADKSIVTSGIYERFLDDNGKTYHHILDPSSGYPFENEIAGVTIVSDTSIDGDALSTSVFSKGVADGMAFINTLEGVDALFITKDREVYMTDGLKETFILDNSDFSIVTLE